MIPASTARPRRHPKGYIGRQHETLGSDILAVTKSLMMPEQVLGPELYEHLSEVNANDWYPIELMLEVMERLDTKVGPFGLVRMGRNLFDLSHKERVALTAKSARDIVFGADEMYRHANRGLGIGGWRVIDFEPGRAVLEKTTPHHCMMEQGVLSGAFSAVNCVVNISQSRCFRDGADACTFVLTSADHGRNWDHTTK